jgi:transposase
MRKKINYQMLLSKPVAELSHQELLDRLEYAETEIAYLKKLEALAQQQKLAPKIKSK